MAPSWDIGGDEEGESTPLSNASREGPRVEEPAPPPGRSRWFFAGISGFAAGALVAIAIFGAGFFALWSLIHRLR